MTGPWDERTEAMPGLKSDKSVDLELDFSGTEQEERSPPGRPNIVVFEPHELGVSRALVELGYPVRVAATGVRAMALVAEETPSVIVCAPAPDAERRRLLVAALRLRFPRVPVVYVSTHAGREAAVFGAAREGARGLIEWPFPSWAEVERVLASYLGVASALGWRRVPAAPGARPGPFLVAGTDPERTERRSGFDTRSPPVGPDRPGTEPTVLERGRPRALPEPVTLPSDAFIPLPAPTAWPAPARAAGARDSGEPSRGNPPRADSVQLADVGDESDVITQPGLRPVALAAVEARAQAPRGEVGALLAAISPFLWSLEDAARWAEGLGAAGNETAANHARMLQLLARILAQLQARIEEENL